ncbi:MAG: kynureninase [Salaquimonas sp.]
MSSEPNIYRKHRFEIPHDIIYLDGNSLGPLPKGVALHASTMIEKEWGQALIKGWNECNWMDQPGRVANLVGRLIGAPQNSVMMGDTLSVKVHQALAAALEMRPDRKVILSDSGNFPTDLYMAEGLIRSLNKGHELRIVAPENIADEINDSIAAVMLTEIDYRTGRKHDMREITRTAHDAGAVMIWDLAHSAGALPVNLEQSNCEFAVGCTYKYLNGGPGAPAFIYVRPDLIKTINPTLSGWLGHDAPFAFDIHYKPAPSIERMRVGTPPVIQLTCLEKALEIWSDINTQKLREASIELSELFIKEVEAKCPQLALASPRNPQERGSQVSFSFEQGYAAMQALIDHGVIGDFRAPNIMRFGITPLYINQADIMKAVDILENIMSNCLWDNAKYKTPNKVT